MVLSRLKIHLNLIKISEKTTMYSDEGHFLENDVQYPEKLHDLHPDLPERMEIEEVEKLAANLHDKEGHVIRIRNLKEVLNHGLVLKKIHRVIKFNQKACLKSYINMNTKLRKNAKNDFEKAFFKMMNNAMQILEKLLKM